MRIRLECLPEEIDAHVEALRRGFDVVEVSKQYPNRDGSRLVRVFVQIRLPDSDQPPANAHAAPDHATQESERLARQVRRIHNVVAWARARVDALHAKRDKMPESQRARRTECDARADEVQRLVDEFDKALGKGAAQR